jgi:hypothetical protein
VAFPFSSAQFMTGLLAICRLQEALVKGGDPPLPLARYWTNIVKKYDVSEIDRFHELTKTKCSKILNPK